MSPEIPKVQDKTWGTNEIDAFVLSNLEDNNMAPSEMASPRAQLRRLFFSLIGLPPSPKQMEEFLHNPSVEAYSQWGEILLADEGYGERWGRHWLDLVRYSDTRGGAIDYPRPHMWRYRDYVIRAFNQDRPYDRFIREQLAGDAYPTYGVEGKLGLGFLHQWVPVERTEPELSRRDYMNDVVSVTGSTFLGLTLSCARCHDHKYDPLPTRDYYRLEAFFAPAMVALESLEFGQYELPLQNPERWEAQKQLWTETLDTREKRHNETLDEFKNCLRDQPRVLSASADVKYLIVDPADDLRTAMNEGLLFTEEEQATYKQIGRQTARFANPNSKDYYLAKAYMVKDSSLHHSVTTHVLGGGNYKLKKTQWLLAF